MRYLSQEEKKNSRELWEEAFPEDSRSFDDYYFEEKLRDNRILAEERDGKIIAMVQLNPYKVRLRERICSLSYIVGVATRADERHRGHMRRLLLRMLEDMNRENVPFTFLMPAAEAIYRPFDFRFIYDQPHLRFGDGSRAGEAPAEDVPAWEKTPASGEASLAGAAWEEIPLPLTAQAAEEISRWQMENLTGRFEVCTVRDEAYVRRQMLELASEAGCLGICRDRAGNILGMESWWGFEKREQRFLYAVPGLAEEARPATPAIMARIVNLREFVKSISLEETAPASEMDFIIEVKDGLIPENDGVFRWSLDRLGSRLEPSRERPEFSADIGTLCQWLFGYKIPGGLPERGGWIRPLRGVFLDEAV